MKLVTHMQFVPYAAVPEPPAPAMSTTASPRDVLSVAEVAERLGVDPKTVRRAIADQEIHAVWVGKRLLVPRLSYERWLRGETSNLARDATIPAREARLPGRRRNAST